MFDFKEMDELNKVLNENCIYKNKKHTHNFIFNGATRQEIVFTCFGCGAFSYLYYDKNYELFDLVINRCLLNNDYISKEELKRDYISISNLKKYYIPIKEIKKYLTRHDVYLDDEYNEDDEDDE